MFTAVAGQRCAEPLCTQLNNAFCRSTQPYNAVYTPKARDKLFQQKYGHSNGFGETATFHGTITFTALRPLQLQPVHFAGSEHARRFPARLPST
jgi:hypothetical protein